MPNAILQRPRHVVWKAPFGLGPALGTLLDFCGNLGLYNLEHDIEKNAFLVGRWRDTGQIGSAAVTGVDSGFFLNRDFP